ncbi:MAG: aspartate carbamoyltransferase catalytic subunit [Candidatus Eisenbacteria bacterium]|uniref:Aspartate carbamoyltransferase n=1 Tax=Eiseniibacteriota bacterium TaxID=2212470 RepID=A0A9D6L5B2_UNCEI|nr:aspartate carbamoyltransferase catalytic subunit [Candidatus Eisenbacteria bacterium]MBI3539158.1 aspartate carbamoyltransferase catalytic subunit [Candidatus Eisenbacteria bacterium]
MPHAETLPAGATRGVAVGLFSASRHLLGLDGMPRTTLIEILDAAERDLAHLAADRSPRDVLRDATVVIAMFEDSTRTRVSFQIAAKRLGATASTFSSHGLSLSKGETLRDTLRIFEANGADVIVVRHPSPGAPAYLAGQVESAVINAGDGMHEHPTQGLLDLMTLRQAWAGRFDGRRIAIIGDVKHSRVARSAIFGLTTLGVAVTVAGPTTLLPTHVERLGCTVAATVDEAMEGADAVMALRLQRERMDQGLLPSLAEYTRVWGIDAARVRRMRSDAVVLHPGPVNRGIELAPDVADGERSVILDQVANGVAVRCAVLRRAAGRDG